MSTKSPTYEEAKRRKNIAATAFEGTLNCDPVRHNQFAGDWIDVSAFGLSRTRSFFLHNEDIWSFTFGKWYKHQQPLLNVDFPEFDRIEFKERQSHEAKEGCDSLSEEASCANGAPRVVTFGPDETFWQRMGAFELAERDYLVFPEYLSTSWTVGGPDLSCFQFGRLQEVLADIGVAPGGAPLMILRSKYDICESTSVDVDESVGVVEAKKDAKNGGKPRRGMRELTRYRESAKYPPYLSGEGIETGWLVCPNTNTVIEDNRDKIGGISWDADGASYYEAPELDADPAVLRDNLWNGKWVVLDSILRYQKLETSLEDAIKSCLEDPEFLYSIFN